MTNQQPPCQTARTLPAHSAWWLLFAWLGLISSLSAQSDPSTFWDQLLGMGNALTLLNGYDKIIHAFVWSILTLFLWLAIAPLCYRSLILRILLIFVLASFIGGLDEFHQYFTPERTCSLFDVAADSFGSAVMLTIIALYKIKHTTINHNTIQPMPE